jgi:hypothetical protein
MVRSKTSVAVSLDVVDAGATSSRYRSGHRVKDAGTGYDWAEGACYVLMIKKEKEL